MESEIVQSPVVEAPPPVQAPEPTEEASIADHEQQFGKGAPKTPSEDTEKPRHRAKSQQATPNDVPRIAELTKRLREAERERDEWKAKHSAPPEPPKAASAPAPEKPADKPSWKTFEEQIGAKFESWADAQDAYIDARDAWKEAQAQKAQAVQQQTTAEQAVLRTYSTKAQEYAKTTPDFFDKMSEAAPVLDHIPDLLFQSIVRHDNGPEIAYYLVTHPVDLDEMCLLTDGKSVSDASVALLQRRLSHYRVPAAATGSVAVVPRTIAPRPPNPVKTAPQKPGEDLPGDDASIADHERAFGKKRRR